ncbi:hypothetical protein [Parasedimentitalea psychrophila]|uniref:Sulfotransferase family protein n=1 Tax=Parasedimentitalea psychrophila TaxID=2997337 RepID=A0A9Y2P654_9RHOB|nr:hypothetical protein [Parasedimentitalea psychrophila]WIY24315.1 hypothetical protein QPJ95_17180 [Parasedimentitalea psychrophila]
MQVIVHTGAHATEEDRLLKSLLRNKQDFSKRGIAVPGPGKYRSLLKDCFSALKAGTAAADSRDVLWDAILDEENADRVVLSNPHFFGSQRSALQDNLLYPEAVQRMQYLQQLFPYDQIEIFMGLRNPAGFLPALLEKASPQRLRDVRKQTDPRQLRWSEMMQRMRQAVPDIAITVWCYEDMPLTWGQILRDMAGLEPNQALLGDLDLLATILSAEGMTRLRSYMGTHGEMSEMQKRRVYAAFLDKFALEDALEEELDLAGWTDELVADLTENYDEDIYHLQRIPGVTLIAP